MKDILWMPAGSRLWAGLVRRRDRSGGGYLVVAVALLVLLGAVAGDSARASDPPEGERCIEFVRADVVGAIKPSVNVTGNTHMVRRKWQSPRGWDAEVLIKWPKPPTRICNGDQLSFRMEVSSFKQYAQDPGGYAGSVFLDVAPSFRQELRCSDSDNRETSGCGVYVMIPESGGWAVANSIIKVPQRQVGLEFPVFHMGLSLDVTGSVHYIYRIVPRLPTDTVRHHDLGKTTDTTEETPPSTSPDSDQDGLSDDDERRRGTDPNDPDSDDDGRTDGQEVQEGSNPLEPSGAPPPPTQDDIGPASDPCRDLGPGTWIVIGSRSGPQGSTARIPVSICGADRLGDLNLTINYSADVLRATDFQHGTMLGDALFDANLEPQGTIRLGTADSQGLSGDGYLVYLEFEVIGAPGSSTPLRGSVTTATRADNDQPVRVQVRDGLFTVASKRGDVNGDRSITSLDALMALRMSIGKLPVNLVADANGDGQVTALDARWILQAATGLRSL